MFVTAVCVLFLIKLRWPKKKSIYDFCSLNMQNLWRCRCRRVVDLKLPKARFKRRTLHVPNLLQMRKIYCFRSFALDSAHMKFDV